MLDETDRFDRGDRNHIIRMRWWYSLTIRCRTMLISATPEPSLLIYGQRSDHVTMMLVWLW